MKKLLFAVLSVSAFGISNTASANPAAKLAQLETKLDRLVTYFNDNCDEAALTPQCKRVDKTVKRIGAEIETIGETINAVLDQGKASKATSKEGNLLKRQYEILLVRLQKIENKIEKIEASEDPQKDAKLKGLETQLTLVRSRLLSLQMQMMET